jgi:hypothetical protein
MIVGRARTDGRSSIIPAVAGDYDHRHVKTSTGAPQRVEPILDPARSGSDVFCAESWRRLLTTGR